jgi:hypothetical protein
MDWIKKNTTLVVSMVIALVAVVGAGYYLMTEMEKSAEVTTKLNSAVQRRDGFVNARPPYHPGFEKVDNIKIAREDFKRLDEFKSDLTKGFKSTVPVSPRNAALRRPWRKRWR